MENKGGSGNINPSRQVPSMSHTGLFWHVFMQPAMVASWNRAPPLSKRRSSQEELTPTIRKDLVASLDQSPWDTNVIRNIKCILPYYSHEATIQGIICRIELTKTSKYSIGHVNGKSFCINHQVNDYLFHHFLFFHPSVNTITRQDHNNKFALYNINYRQPSEIHH